MRDERAGVSFPDWKGRLAAENWTPAGKQQAAREIIGFLRHCKVLHSQACIAVAKAYLARLGTQAESPTPGTATRASRRRRGGEFVIHYITNKPGVIR